MIAEKFELPTSKVYLYTREGNLNGEIVYPLNIRGDSDQNMVTKSDKQHRGGMITELDVMKMVVETVKRWVMME